MTPTRHSDVQLIIAVSATPGQSPRPTAYSCNLSKGNRELNIEGAFPNSTPERTALHALITALKAFKTPAHIRVVTSSRYLTRGLTQWIGQLSLARHTNGDLWSRLIDAAHTHLLSTDLRDDTDPIFHSPKTRAEEARINQTNATSDTDQTGHVLPLLTSTLYATVTGQPFTATTITAGTEQDPSLPDLSHGWTPALSAPDVRADEQARLDAHFQQGRAQIRQALQKNPYLVGHTLLMMDLDPDGTHALVRTESMLMTVLAAHQVTLTPATTSEFTELVSLMHAYLSAIPREHHTASQVTTTFSDAGNWTAHTHVAGQPLRLIILKDDRNARGRTLTGITTPHARLVTLHLP